MVGQLSYTYDLCLPILKRYIGAVMKLEYDEFDPHCKNALLYIHKSGVPLRYGRRLDGSAILRYASLSRRQ